MRELAWLGVLICACGCIDAKAGSGHAAAVQLDADGGESVGFDAGPVRPPTGHLPDASFCQPGSSSSCGRAGDGPSGAQQDQEQAQKGTDAGYATAGAPDGSPGVDAGPLVPAPAHAGDLVITELLVDPKTLRDTDGEWFELYNPGMQTLDLQGCSVGDGSTEPHALTEHLLAPAGAYLSVARAAAPGFTPDAITSFSFTNTKDTLVVSCGGTEIDRVAYDHAQGFPIATGASAQLDPGLLDAQANDDPGAWCLATDSYGPERGTPGAPNRPCAAPDAAIPASP